MTDDMKDTGCVVYKYDLIEENAYRFIVRKGRREKAYVKIGPKSEGLSADYTENNAEDPEFSRYADKAWLHGYDIPREYYEAFDPCRPFTPCFIGDGQEKCALRLVFKAYGSSDEASGVPTILHPLTVGLAGRNEQERCVGYLHDIVEDRRMSFAEIEEAGVGHDVVEAVKLLTRDQDTSYAEYIDCIISSGNKVAVAVKLNDLRHNLRRGKDSDNQERYRKHLAAMERFKAAGLV